MLLKSLNVLNSRGSLLELGLEDTSSGFVIKGIEGLDPVAATLSSSSFANLDGEQYHSARREKRNIKIKLGLNPNYANIDAKTLRDQLYDYFMPKTQVKLTFKMFDRFTHSIVDQYLSVDILGRIETFDSPLFVAEPEIDISLICFKPDFINPIPVELDGMTVSDTTDTLVTYAGTVDTGLVITVSPDRTLSQFTIYNQAPDGSYHASTMIYAMLAGDVIIISSVPGSKFAYLTRAGVTTSILYGIQPFASWINFQPGVNRFRVAASGAAIPYSVTYTDKYGGL